jgi:hypothetical protein
MRKMVSFTLVLVALVLSLNSCGDDSAASFDAVGTWLYINEMTGLPTWDYRLVFKSDMTWERFYGEELASPGYGTWDYADSWDKTSYGVALLTGFGSRPFYIPYDPATKELVFKISYTTGGGTTDRFKKQ